MPDRFEQLMLRQMDDTLEELRDLSDAPRPRGGWLRSIRKALGMTTTQLAERLGVHQSTVSRYEKSEAEGGITLKTLRRVASALESELVYAVVPSVSIQEIRERRARKVARRRVEAVDDSMKLEDQGISNEEKRRQVEELTRDILNEWPRTIWDDP